MDPNSRPATPRWVKVFGAIAALAVMLFALFRVPSWGGTENRIS